MNILLLAPQPFYQLRGTPIAVKLLAEVLSKKGHLISLLTYHEGDDVEIPNVALRRISKIPFVNKIPPGPSIKKILCDLIIIYESIKLIKAHRYDLIHAVEEAALIAALLKKLYKIPYIYDMDSSISQQITEKYALAGFLKPFLSFLESYAIKQSLGVIAVCRYLEDIVSVLDPLKPVLRLEDISLLGKPVCGKEDLKETLNIGGKIIMYVGNLEKYQGVDLLLSSFQKVTEEIQSVHLIIIGGNKRSIDNYRNKASLLKLRNRAHFIGPRPLSYLASYLKQADVLVSPRIQGLNTPMKIYSYLDSGKPVVATSLPTHTQVLNNEIAMMVAPDTNDMAQGLITLLNDEKRSKGIARRAKKRVNLEFCMDAYERKLCGFYSEMESKLFNVQPAQIGGYR